jgi:hypothetical protein
MIHWKKLPKLTSVGNYEINVPLDDFTCIIDKYINQYSLDLNPDFQRGRVWKEYQQIKYIEFLLMGSVTNNVLYFNHPGWMNSYNGDFVIVDGLQRITSILDFLDNKFKAFNEYYSSDVDLKDHYNIKFNINNLKTRKEVLKWYLEINSNGTPHTEDEIEKVKNLLKEIKE